MPTTARRRRAPMIRRVIALVVALVVVAACCEAARRYVGGRADAATAAAFYDVPVPLPHGRPGEIIRVRPVPEAPAGSVAWRVVYHTRDLAGRDIPASAIVVEPVSALVTGARTVVAWGHPTTGAAQRGAPSLATDPFELIEGLHALLASGFAVVAADYPGMGVAGDSSYLIGVTESNSMLDAVRAAREIHAARIGTRLLLWGHSQGGQAALFAAERVRNYAPELHLAGVAVAAPAADLGALLDDDIDDLSGTSITSYALPAMTAAYQSRYPDDPLGSILTPAGAAATPEMSQLCLTDPRLHEIARPLVGDYVTSSPAKVQPWARILAENSAGHHRIDAPIFVGQGLADQLVRPSVTASYVAGLCRSGEQVDFHEYSGVNHGWAAYRSLVDVVPWFQSVLHGSAGSTCERHDATR